MATDWVDVERIRASLSTFFTENREEVNRFGSTVNQVFEAFVFASVIQWYRDHGWQVAFIHPPAPQGKGPPKLRLKFSTRGRPSGYSYASCSKDNSTIHVRHQLRTATRSYVPGSRPRANICLDIAIHRPVDLGDYTTDDALPNDLLVTFGEAKHMSAFAELVASFVGVVHEMQPERLVQAPQRPPTNAHPAPFLYVSGFLNHTAQGVIETIHQRGTDMDVYSRISVLTSAMPVPSKPAPPKPPKQRPRAFPQKR